VLSKEQLRTIINEIEYLFESQLGFNVFDYSKDGKPIDIVYLKASKKKKKLQRYLKNSESLKNKINNLHPSITSYKKSMKLQ
jgi:ABC-type ATPase with predicted acetyltransferase domain